MEVDKEQVVWLPSWQDMTINNDVFVFFNERISVKDILTTVLDLFSNHFCR